MDIRCPFHEDRKIGNAGFNEALNIFKCQACGASGNSVTLVMQQQQLTASEAVEWLNSEVTVSAPRQSSNPLPWERHATFRQY